MCQEADYLIKASALTTRALFLQDETLKRAFVRSLEIIGEAVKQIPDAPGSAMIVSVNNRPFFLKGSFLPAEPCI